MRFAFRQRAPVRASPTGVGLNPAARAMLSPDLGRVAACDALWRGRLADSLDYLGDVLSDRGQDVRLALNTARARLAEGPASPWASCLYSKLVADVSKPQRPTVEGVVQALAAAATQAPREERALRLLDGAIPAAWWDQFLLLMDTDRKLPFRPSPPPEPVAAVCERELAEGLALLARADPAFHDEVRGLVRVVVLGAPSDDDPVNRFGACSSFFLREAVLVNAAVARSPIRAIDLLVHEASHVLLFGLAIEQPLTTDAGRVRLRSAARPDPRPVDGLFHACFVSTRVHLAMERMLARGLLTEAEASEAVERRDRNGHIAQDTLETLKAHAATTPLGAEILSALSAYWAVASASASALSA
jgi:hypothetical protein